MKKSEKSKDYIEKNENFVLKEEKEGGILLNPSSGEFAVINKTGCLIWKFIDGRNSKNDIVAKIAKKFEVPQSYIKKDVLSFLDQLKRNGLVNNFIIPENVCFAITGRCNLRCKHCGAKETWGTKDMSTKMMSDIIDQMGMAGVKAVSLFGGEPLLREDIFVLIERLKRYSIRISVNTNATLITEQLAEKFKEKGIKNFVVSLDGATREVHDRQRGNGSFYKAIRGIKILVSKGMSVLLSFIVTKINEKDIERFAELGRDLGVTTVRYNHVFYTGNALCYEKDVYISPSENKKISRRIFKLSRKYGKFITGSYLQEYEKLKNLCKIKPEQNRITVPPCGAGVMKIAIRPDGWITPCEVIWEVKAGNIKKKSFIEICRDSKVIKEFRSVKYIDLKSTPECKNCQYQFICFKGHRCYPFYYPNGLRDKKFYCYKKF